MSRLTYGAEIDVEAIDGSVEMIVEVAGEWLCADLTPLEAIGLAEQLRKAAGMDEVTS